MENLVLIDGNSLINRAFYAMPLLSTKSGVYTNAVYGFMNMFCKMFSDIKPNYVAVAFDLKAPTFRHKMYSEYKGTRKPMPEELRPQIPLLKEVLKLMNITVVEKEGMEADDIIGTIAKHTSVNTIILTGDKDSFQLVDNETEVHFTKRGISETEVYNATNFTEKTGIKPYQIIELKALMGDASDNIPGVAGVGEKTALSLVQKYGDIENLYSNLDELTGKLKEKIQSGEASARLSKILATINLDCGVATDVDEMRVVTPFPSAVKQKFVELELRSLYNRSDLFENSGITAKSEHEPKPVKDATRFNANLEDSRTITSKETKVSNAEKKVDREIKIVNIDNIDDFDCEKCDGETAFALTEKQVSVYCDGAEYVFGIRNGLLDDGFPLSEILKKLAPIFIAKTRLTVFDKKELRHLLAEIELPFTRPADDVSIMKYLADFSGRAEKLGEVLLEYGRENQPCAAALHAVCTELKDRLKAEDMEKLYYDLELPLSDVLYDMEVSGFKVDYNALSEAGRVFRNRLNVLEEKIRGLADEPTLNVNSPKQLGEVLFEKLKIAKGKKTKSGYSTSADVLENIDDAHPIIPLILEYRKIGKLYSTYIEGFKPLIEKNTGLIRTSFNQTVTTTGRLSSKEPNLQNIPVRDEEGKELRKFFVPRDSEHILVGADYSQIELRLLAAFSDCKGLKEAFLSGKDVHTDTAARVFKVPLSSVTSEMRRAAKAVNFGIIYGISEYGLAKNLKISAAEAREYINSYFKEYPEVKEYMEKNVAFAKKTGYAVTMLGRKRYIRELSSGNYNLRSFGERAAMNMPLQGSSADIIKLAMLGVYNRLKKERLKSLLILQVHDELIIDALKSEKEEVEKLLKEEMENAVSLSVKLSVSAGSGENWYEAK